MIGQDLFADVQVERVEPAMIHLRQRPLDQVHLFRSDFPGPLRRGQHRPPRQQGFAEHAHPVPDLFGGPDPAGRLTG
jgi:hypothetical protein